MTVKELMTQLAKFNQDQEVSVSEHGKTQVPLFGILEGTDPKTEHLLILVGSLEFKTKN